MTEELLDISCLCSAQWRRPGLRIPMPHIVGSSVCCDNIYLYCYNHCSDSAILVNDCWSCSSSSSRSSSRSTHTLTYPHTHILSHTHTHTHTHIHTQTHTHIHTHCRDAAALPGANPPSFVKFVWALVQFQVSNMNCSALKFSL